MEAFSKFGITRLSGRIYNLKEQGHKISCEIKTVKARSGRPANIAVYRLEEE